MSNQLTIDKLLDPPDREEAFRQNLEDAAKDYSETDVLVEILQNALDALDQRRFEAICEAAGRDPYNVETVGVWNDVVMDLVEADYKAFEKAKKKKMKETHIAVLYEAWEEEDERRAKWWEALAKAFDADAGTLERAGSAAELGPRVVITVNPATKYIEVEDAGVGMDLSMENIPRYLRHQGSTKRRSKRADKRLGERGNHGWGLTAVLAYSDDVQFVSKSEKTTLKGWELRNFRSFANKTGQTQIVQMESDTLDGLIQDTDLNTNPSGTLVRVSMGAFDSKSEVGWLLDNFTLDRLATYLRVKTPIGQVNDYLLHPGFHCYRRGDGVEVVIRDGDSGDEATIPLDYFRLSEVDDSRCETFAEFQNAPSKDVSIHTVARYKSSSNLHVLTAADIQVARLLREFEGDLAERKAMPARVDDTGDEDFRLQQSFTFAYSGGLLSPTLAVAAKGNVLMFRGVTLAEESLPTLARKHLPGKLDGRSAIASSCTSHMNLYESARTQLTDKTPGGAGSPAIILKRQDEVTKKLERMVKDDTVSPDLHVWAPYQGGEAKVMLVFAELLARGVFGEFRIVDCGLGEQYDLTFMYESSFGSSGIPRTGLANSMITEGFATKLGKGGDARLRWIGFGEFKFDGDTLFNDVGPKKRIKKADEIDVLICWDFEESVLGEHDWNSQDVTRDADRVLPQQTHVWKASASAKLKRSRGLPVIALEAVLENLESSKKLEARPDEWETIPNYYKGE